MSHLVRIPPSRWSTLKPGQSVAVWVSVPNPDVGDVCISGQMVGFEQSGDEPALRLRTVGRVESVIPTADITTLMRARLVTA